MTRRWLAFVGGTLVVASFSCDLSSSGQATVAPVDSGPDAFVIPDATDEPIPVDAGPDVDAGPPDSQPPQGPAAIAGLELWLNAATGVELDDAGIRVTRWADGSGKNDPARTATSSGNGPTLVDAGGKPAVAFTLTQNLVTGAWSSPITQPSTVFFVGGRPLGLPKTGYLLDSLTPAAQFAIYLAPDEAAYALAPVALGSSARTTPLAMIVAIVDGAQSQVLLNQIARDGGVGNPGANGATGLTIGNYAGGGAFAFDGFTYEIALWKKRLTPKEIADLGAYASTRYGIVLQ